MAQDWTVQAIGGPPGPDADPAAVASVLRRVLDAVEPAVAARPGRPARLLWSTGEERLRPVRPDLTELVVRGRERHADGDPVGGGASVGALLGRLAADDVRPAVAVSWELGGAAAGSVRVLIGAAALGELAEQPLPALVALLDAVAEACDADAAQITTRPLARALAREGVSLASGALTRLPAHATAEPPPGFVLAGRVLVADLHAVATAPDDVARALVPVDRLLVGAAPADSGGP
jgi:hypothetical protein